MPTKETLQFVKSMSVLVLLGQGSPNVFVRGPHKLLHNRSRAGHLAQCCCFGIRYILPNQQIFRKCNIFSLLKNIFAGRMKWHCEADLAHEP